jgi:hypothetical protein
MKITLENALKRARGPFYICQDTVERPKADAPVLIHCFSNFAEAVALLKQTADYLDGSDLGVRLSRRIDEALRRFETVEVP